MQVKFIHLSQADSTNKYLKELISTEKIQEGTVVTADYQMAGRGQIGNSWESEKRKNLLFSIVLYPSFLSVKKQFIISQLISLAIKNALDKYSHYITIKWPNDIYWKEKKICGILIENNIFKNNISQSVIGIGININQITFSDTIPNAVSLKQITGIEYNLLEILNEIIFNISNFYEIAKVSPDTVIKEYKENLFRKNGFHKFHDESGSFSAEIVDIELSGHLILKTEKGEKRKYAFKEIKFC